eukprot:CAMPEP_0181318334 /NCGR_PEP_ID=MMETSP1101-20121128/16949_1 /TAXON_ID=46948 /ORGANISM="Rhodomonas abbreviata, Strain Caron Lab Isolate" /LENGTH=110 /DNA_ID=CAMNT_0023425793 /DNA_START=62 /DNA_END=394 /DNA_ORIENTATION=+
MNWRWCIATWVTALTGLLLGLGWALAGGIVGFVATIGGCELVSRILERTSLQRFQPCGPAHGLAVLYLGPGSGAIIWFFAPPALAPCTCFVLTSTAVALSTAFASVAASD